MQRVRRYCPAGFPVHVIQRGNNRIECFRSDDDCATYIGCLRKSSDRYGVDIHAWVLMTNHVHLLVTPGSDTGVSLMMQDIGRNYVRYFNKRYERSGTLWEGRFRSCLVQNEHYFLLCQRYIELNPVRAGMVTNPGDYHWSSYHSNANGVKSSLIKPHPAYLALGNKDERRSKIYRDLFLDAIPRAQIEELRMSTQRNLGFGSDAFKLHIESLAGRRIRLLKRGPKSGKASNF